MLLSWNVQKIKSHSLNEVASENTNFDWNFDIIII